MYDDYDVVYKSNINEFLIYWIILGIIVILLIALTFISLSKVFKKANRSGISAFMPFYNIYVLVELANLPKSYFFLGIIPIINIPFLCKINMEIAKLFKKSPMYGIGITFLPFIYLPLLAFSDSEYIGINIVAMDNKNTVEKIAVIDDNKTKEIEKEENTEEDIKSRNVNISIGGGAYQKDYDNKVESIDESKLLYKNKQVSYERVDLAPRQGIFIDENMIKEPEVEEKKEEPQTVFSVPYINGNEKKEEKQEIKKIPITLDPNKEVDLLKSNQPTEVKLEFCPNCGTRVAENSKICMICGHELK